MAPNNGTFGRVSTPSAGGSGAATTVFGGTIDPVAQRRVEEQRLAAFRDPGVEWLAGRFGHVPDSVQRELLAQIQPGQPAAVRMAAVNRIAAIAEAGDGSRSAWPIEEAIRVHGTGDVLD